MACIEDALELCKKHFLDHVCRDFDTKFVQVIQPDYFPEDVFIEYNFFSKRIAVTRGDQDARDADDFDFMALYLRNRSLKMLEIGLLFLDNRYALMLKNKLVRSILLHDKLSHAIVSDLTDSETILLDSLNL